MSDSLLKTVSESTEAQAEATEAVAENTETQNLESKEAGAEQAAESTEVQATEAKKEEIQEAKPEAEKQEKNLATKFAALSRKEKALRQREKDLEKRIKELEEKAAKPAEVVQEPLDLRIKKDPFGTLKELGLDLDTITKIALNDGKLPPELQTKIQVEEQNKALQSRIDALEKKLDEKDKAAEEKQQAATQEAQLKAFKGQISDHISKNAAEYELLAVEGDEGIDVVYEVMENHWNQTLEETGEGEVLTFKQAADLVEEHLLEEAKKRLGLGKLKKLLEQQSKPAATQKTEVKPEKRQSVTLSNEQSAASVGKKPGVLSREEAIEEAAKLIRFQE